MSDNKKLQSAKEEQKAEFYTEYNTISNEVGYYRTQLKGQIVYCNCDDPSWSNFWRYFHSNFASLGLKKLISTHYQKDTEPSYAMIYEGGDDFNMDAGDVIDIHGNTAVVNGKEVFYTAGDFRSAACLKYLDEATVVVSNPPFYLFREYIACLIEHEKKFLILGNQNASTTKEIFPLFKDNKVWYGVSLHGERVEFRVPDDYPLLNSTNRIDEHGNKYIRINGGIRWFTNLDVQYRHDGLWHKNGTFDNSQAHCYYEGNEDAYPQYDNYSAIEIGHMTRSGRWEGRTELIPIDYTGVMGVPITFLDKFNPEEFEILGITDRQNTSGLRTKKYTVEDHPKYNDLNARSVLVFPDGEYKPMYPRILIRNLHPIKKSDDLGY
ncbi:MAG: adenosine deaminase [Eubacterium sp.]|nr:adenosine deaminase [Eubacterium sp.]MBQ6362487.1 adenosine deaminase [Lachnospiraceae bacterium]